MPHLVRWNSELKNYGLVVIGAHNQAAKDEEVQAKSKALGINFSVVKASFTKAPANGAFGIPYCLLFDHAGKCLYAGAPDGAEKLLRPALGKAVVQRLETQPQTKSVSALATALKSGQAAPATVLPRAVALLKSKDTAVAEEAKALADGICFVGREQYDEAEKMKGEDPYGAYVALEKLPTQYRGTPLAADATKSLSELKKDKAVIAELKARPGLVAVKSIDDNLTKSAKFAKVEANDPKFLRANGQALQNLRRAVLALKKSYPDSKAAAEAATIAEKYGIMLP